MRTKKKTTFYTLPILGVFILLISFLGGCHSNKEITTPSIQETIKLHFIDTGNSDAILIQDGKIGVLIDGGDNDDEEFVPNYIKAQGIEKLNYVIATHPDADHIGGLDGVVRNIKVERVLVSNGDADTKTYRDFISALIDKGLSPSVPLVGSTFSFGKGEFKVLSAADVKDPNERSIVLLYTYGKDKMLFMGDAGTEVEKNLECGPVDLIKLGHHGSSSSSSLAFLKQVTPQKAVLTVGSGNKYGHPHKEIMEHLKTLNIPVYRTDEGGTLVFESTGKGIKALQEPHSYLNGSTNQSVVEGQMNETPTPIESTIKNEALGKVYFTSTSKKYHSTPTCSNMKAPIEATIKEVGKRKACQICF
ncbi:MBL fold hydrolase [Sporanaerobium hydrogeniformans]|uniref:MBL fold hydrolase n=1 Tax=Sporanaerobium hydrogeniformans TaxID=3072179 RepID=A0AC61DGC6_9FIRM|nr:ComEC/Rec2 family competence protein [Sporanaerobium hydrogeniformans]PHV71662.1 MBL fold hydrolase [Sporanaerobium hydrogeniformans]